MINPIEWVMHVAPPKVERGALNSGYALLGGADIDTEDRIASNWIEPRVDGLTLALDLGADQKRFESSLIASGSVARRRGSGEFTKAGRVDGVCYFEWGHKHDPSLAWCRLDSAAIADGRARAWAQWTKNWVPWGRSWITRWDPAFTFALTHPPGRLLVHGGRMAEEMRGPDCPMHAPYVLNSYFGSKQNVFVRSYHKNAQLLDQRCNCLTKGKTRRRRTPRNEHCLCDLGAQCGHCGYLTAFTWRVEASVRPTRCQHIADFVSAQENPFRNVRLIALDRITDRVHRLLFVAARLNGAASIFAAVRAHATQPGDQAALPSAFQELLDAYEADSALAVPPPRLLFDTHRQTLQAQLSRILD